jgi:hypothetical protein
MDRILIRDLLSRCVIGVARGGLWGRVLTYKG